MKKAKLPAILISIAVFIALFSLLINACGEDSPSRPPIKASSQYSVASQTPSELLWEDS